jgi:hypothetical protein
MTLARQIREKLIADISLKVSKQPCRYTIKRCGCIYDGREPLVRCSRHTTE